VRPTHDGCAHGTVGHDLAVADDHGVSLQEAGSSGGAPHAPGAPCQIR
jgi:hypothetical protein